MRESTASRDDQQTAMGVFEQRYIEEKDYDEQMQAVVEPLWSSGYGGCFSGALQCQIQFYVVTPVKPRGTLVVVPGTSETFIKYKEFCYDAVRFGFKVFLLDHRGHGYSERIIPHNNDIVHVDRFAYYVDDLRSFLRQVVAPDQVGKLMLFGHSLGGLIAATLLSQDSALVQAAVFNAPMFGLKTVGIPNQLLRMIVAPFVAFNVADHYSFGQHASLGERDFSEAGTFCEARFDYYVRQLKTHENALLMGGVSHGWLYECLGAIADLKKQAAHISTKIRVIGAGHDTFVDTKAEHHFVQTAGNADIIFIEEAAHEAWNDRDHVRKRTMDAIFGFFEKQLNEP